MRVLVLSDVHAEEGALEDTRSRLSAERYDAVVLLGDITNRGPVSFAEDFLEMLGESEVKVFALFGNMDVREVRLLLEEAGVGIHAKKVELGEGWSLAGFGGSGPTPFGTPTEFSEEEIYNGLKGLKIDAKTILATHAPPYDVGLDNVRSGPAGSRSIRRIIEERQPAINLCGHIHEHEGEAKIGETRIVKVGAAMMGRAAELEVGKKIEAKLISL